MPYQPAVLIKYAVVLTGPLHMSGRFFYGPAPLRPFGEDRLFGCDSFSNRPHGVDWTWHSNGAGVRIRGLVRSYLDASFVAHLP